VSRSTKHLEPPTGFARVAFSVARPPSPRLRAGGLRGPCQP
jgi:hypothetical protein